MCSLTSTQVLFRLWVTQVYQNSQRLRSFAALRMIRAESRHQFWSVDIRYLDMHRLGEGMIYCISILENFSRAILASGISRKQDTEAFFAVFYDAVRHFRVPEVLVSDNGSVFTSHDTRWTCERLRIEKKEIKKGRPYQNYIEAAFGVH